VRRRWAAFRAEARSESCADPGGSPRRLPGLQQTGFVTVRRRPAPWRRCGCCSESRQRGALGATRARFVGWCTTSTRTRGRGLARDVDGRPHRDGRAKRRGREPRVIAAPAQAVSNGRFGSNDPCPMAHSATNAG